MMQVWLSGAPIGWKAEPLVHISSYICLFLGRDCIGCAKTGSGKTAAFALPILQKLSEDPYGIFALVLTPTRWAILTIKGPAVP